MYYDRIARRWHQITGYHGGAFKRYTLNDLILDEMGGISGRSILELGAGNGYFLPMALRRYSGQSPRRIVVSDSSSELLHIAQTEFWIANAEYLRLDVRDPFPFEDASFDLVLATMLFNELTTTELRATLAECSRVLRQDGRLVATVTHPAFVANLAKRGQLRDFGRGLATLPGTDGIPLPVARRAVEAYRGCLTDAGFTVTQQDVFANEKVLHEKHGLRHASQVPLALMFVCSAISLYGQSDNN